MVGLDEGNIDEICRINGQFVIRINLMFSQGVPKSFQLSYNHLLTVCDKME